jgi:hypothetical protein
LKVGLAVNSVTQGPGRPNYREPRFACTSLKAVKEPAEVTRSALPNTFDCSSARSSSSLHPLKEQALIANKAATLSDESRSRLTLRIGCNHLAVPSVAFFVWKSEHSDGDIPRAIIAKSRKTRPYSVWTRPGYEIPVMDTPVAFDQRNPGACIGLKRSELVRIERVANLTRYCLIILHCSPLIHLERGPSTRKSACFSRLCRYARKVGLSVTCPPEGIRAGQVTQNPFSRSNPSCRPDHGRFRGMETGIPA